MSSPKVVIISGGGSGIGAAAALLFAEHGASVVITGRREAALQATAAKANALNKGKVLPVVADVTNADDWQRVVSQTVAHFGGLDVLINNAGWEGPSDADLRNVSVEDLRRLVDINVVGPLLGAKFAIAELLKRNGTIIITSSVVSLMQREGGQASALYGPTKSADDAITRQLHGLYGAAGVKVFAVNPAVYESEMSTKASNMVALQAMGMNDLTKVAWLFNPLGKVGDSRDVAALYFHLATGSHKYKSGDCIVVVPGEIAGQPLTTDTSTLVLASLSPVPGELIRAFSNIAWNNVSGSALSAADAERVHGKIKVHIQEVMAALAASLAKPVQ